MNIQLQRLVCVDMSQSGLDTAMFLHSSLQNSLSYVMLLGDRARTALFKSSHKFSIRDRDLCFDLTTESDHPPGFYNIFLHLYSPLPLQDILGLLLRSFPMMLPPLCFTVEMVCLQWYVVLTFCLNEPKNLLIINLEVSHIPLGNFNERFHRSLFQQWLQLVKNLGNSCWFSIWRIYLYTQSKVLACASFYFVLEKGFF